jgi:hypothetical protein
LKHDENNQKEKPAETETDQPKLEEQMPKELRKPSDMLAKTLLDAIEFRPSFFGVGINLQRLFKGKAKEDREFSAERQKSIEERKIAIVKQLLESDIDPGLFDVLLQNEVDRRLKVRFGVTFLILTFLFTTASYAIVIFDGAYEWNISEVAITALIIETPIQFIGLLYIIARNLFPQQHADSETGEDK